MEKFIQYTPQEIFNILQINQSIWSSLDNEVDVSLVKKEDSIFDWRDMNDLVGWIELSKFQNEVFNLSLSRNEWLGAVSPESEKTVWQLCEFIAGHAKKEIIQPIRIFGKECFSAAIFFSLKRDLSKWGLDVKDVRPSSPISLFTDFENFPKLVAVVSRRGISISDSIELKDKKGLSFLQKINFLSSNKYIDTGTVKTFRDLTIRILNKSDEYCHS
jgi:hypothetical protein